MADRKGTQTEAFGSRGRENHDASRFYASKLYQQLDRPAGPAAPEAAVPPAVLDRVLRATSEQMHQLPDNCVHLMVTSPPYNVGKVYDENLSLAEYVDFLSVVFSEVYRVLVHGGRACVNIANLGRKPYIPLNAALAETMAGIGFLMRGEIIWDKAASVGSSTAWGSWMSPSNPTLRDVHEYILVFSKGSFSRSTAGRESTITRDEFLAYTKSIWSFPTESASRVNHPAPFPVELPRRLMQLYTFASDVVLDPFMGSGSTAVAAVKTGRHFVGYEIDDRYATIAEARVERVRQTQAQLTFSDEQ